MTRLRKPAIDFDGHMFYKFTKEYFNSFFGLLLTCLATYPCIIHAGTAGREYEKMSTLPDSLS